MLGTAKVYLALALDSHEGQRGRRRSDQLGREGLHLHNNLEHVWQEVESKFANQPQAAVQRLRGICDLDLTSAQARLLCNILARATDRRDLNTSSFYLPARPPGTGRTGSIPPERRAPADDGRSTPMRGRSPSRDPWLGQSRGQSMERGRGRSLSPLPGTQIGPGAGLSLTGSGGGWNNAPRTGPRRGAGQPSSGWANGGAVPGHHLSMSDSGGWANRTLHTLH